MIAAALTDSSFFVGGITAILSGGIVYAFVAFRKAGPEIEAISVTTLQKVIQELRTELSRLSTENEHLRESNLALQRSVTELQIAVAKQGP